MTRVSLSMDESVLQLARNVSSARGTSISKLFVAYIVSQSEAVKPEQPLPPLTRQALGLGKPDSKLPDDWDYREALSTALTDKYED